MWAVTFVAAATCLVSAKIHPNRNTTAHLASQQQVVPGKQISDSLSPFYAPLRSKKLRTRGKPLVGRSKFPEYGVAKAISDALSANWWTEVQLGNQTVELMLDTGSSNTWVLREGFICTNGTEIQPQAYCNDGPYFNGTFSGGQIEDENFNTSYASGEFLVGQVGYERITVAGITVPQQEIGLVDYAYWPAGATGLLGLAWPALTKAYNGTNATADGSNEPAHQSIALGRLNSEESYIAFGGLPPVETHGTFTSSPMLLDPHYSLTNLTTYFINVDAFTYKHYLNATDDQLSGKAIVDSGTIAILVPDDVADAYSKLFKPPAILPPEVGLYVTECDAEGPKEPFSVTINGTNFEIPGSDFVLSGVILSENGLSGPYGNYCFCGLQSAEAFGDPRYILGRPFLENVVAVHDIEAKEMRFAQRKY